MLAGDYCAHSLHLKQESMHIQGQHALSDVLLDCTSCLERMFRANVLISKAEEAKKKQAFRIC